MEVALRQKEKGRQCSKMNIDGVGDICVIVLDQYEWRYRFASFNRITRSS